MLRVLSRAVVLLATLPKDAIFKRAPVDLEHPELEPLAAAYYALQVMGDVDCWDSHMFADIHTSHVSLYDEASIAARVGQHGVDVAKFAAAFRSFDVNINFGQAEQRAADYRIPGVPTLGMQGSTR